MFLYKYLVVTLMLIVLSESKNNKGKRPANDVRDSETGLPLPGSRDNRPDRKMNKGRSQVEINGKSGRIVLYRKPPTGTSNDTMPMHPIIIRMYSLREVNQSGAELCATGNTKHTVASFAGMNFTYSSLTNVTIPHSTILASHLSLQTAVTGFTSRVTLNIYMPFASGNVTLGDEINALQVGEMKISVVLDNWEWCSADVAFIDFSFAISSKQKPQKKHNKEARKPTTFDLGNEANMTLSQKVEMDGSFVNMDSNYPLIEVKGRHNVITFRIARFTTSAVYDPSISTGSDNYYSSMSAARSALSFVLLLTTMTFYYATVA